MTGANKSIKAALSYAAAISIVASLSLRAEPPAAAVTTSSPAAISVTSTNEIHNLYLKKDQPADSTPAEAITNSVNAYLGEASKDWGIVFIMPTWYKDHSVQEVVLEPANSYRSRFPHLKSVFIENGKLLRDENGTVISYETD